MSPLVPPKMAFMWAADIKKLLKAEPFEPIRLALSDGRSVLVRHPDQAVVAERHILIGLATVDQRRNLATPRSGDTIALDWLIVNLLHITTIEPANGVGRRRSSGKRKR